MSIPTVELRDIREEDFAVLFEYQREPEANAMAAFPARDYEAFIKHLRDKMMCDPKVKMKCIVSNKKVVGDIVSWEKEEKRLVGYWIGKAYWGRGFASSALSNFLNAVDSSRPLYASVATHNKASIRVLEKCGFQKFGEKTIGPDGVEDQLMKLV